jgi:hypothetical protein
MVGTCDWVNNFQEKLESGANSPYIIFHVFYSFKFRKDFASFEFAAKSSFPLTRLIVDSNL